MTLKVVLEVLLDVPEVLFEVLHLAWTYPGGPGAVFNVLGGF